MRRVGLVSCVKTKRNEAAPARDLYLSDWFQKARAYADRAFDAWYILSAKHGLTGPDEVLAPYERSLQDLSSPARRKWAACVYRQLSGRLEKGDVVVFLAGRMYREHLCLRLQQDGRPVEIPMKGLGIGQQKAWLKKRLTKP